MTNSIRTLMATVAVTAIAGVAYADSPHFVSASDSIITTAPDGVTNLGDLVVSWKEAGLGDNMLVAYTAAADGSATSACINKGGNHPSASNKETVNGPVSASGSFSSGKNGQITQSLTVEEPSPGSFSCPSGQSFVLASVSYTMVSISDNTNRQSEALPNQSVVFCDITNLTKATVKNCASVD
jgi:hypothetical protein